MPTRHRTRVDALALGGEQHRRLTERLDRCSVGRLVAAERLIEYSEHLIDLGADPGEHLAEEVGFRRVLVGIDQGE